MVPTTIDHKASPGAPGGGQGLGRLLGVGRGVQKVVTPVVPGGQAATHLSVDVTGGHTLTLDVGDAGDGVGHDNGDWGGAELFQCSG
ncbi:MAG TPA: NPCBM/NEW2 domain-containing protein [Actinomycetes bacterium]|nr:NPCBM/NEW2 domain-containing protein [Actinomycetes bacterium]